MILPPAPRARLQTMSVTRSPDDWRWRTSDLRSGPMRAFLIPSQQNEVDRAAQLSHRDAPLEVGADGGTSRPCRGLSHPVWMMSVARERQPISAVTGSAQG